MMKNKNFVPLNDVFDGKALDSDVPLRDLMVSGSLENKQVAPYGDGVIAFAPQSLSPMGFVYNKHYFEKNNLTVPVTWDEFFALGDRIKGECALFTYQGIYASDNESFILPAIASSVGPEALQKIVDYEEGAWNDPNVLRVLEVFARIGTGGLPDERHDRLKPYTIAGRYDDGQSGIYIKSVGVWLAAAILLCFQKIVPKKAHLLLL